MHRLMPCFEFLEKSRKRPEPGDWFATLRDDGRYYFGHVVLTDARAAFGGHVKEVVVYVFRERSERPVLPRRLGPGDLALPPNIINRRGWLRAFSRFGWAGWTPRLWSSSPRECRRSKGKHSGRFMRM